MEIYMAWHFPVIWYLYLAGLGAGAVVISAYSYLANTKFEGGHYHYFRMARLGAFIGPFPVVIGASLLIFELGRPDRPLNLFKVINLSPMSIGSWFLLLFIFTGVLYSLTFLPSTRARWLGLKQRVIPIQQFLALLNIALGIGVAVYTGILLGAMPSRPLWNSPILALLFLVSALSTGIASIMLGRSILHKKAPDSDPERRLRLRGRRKAAKRPGRRYHETGYLLAATDLIFISMELLVIFLFIMFAHLTVGNIKYAVAAILPGGEMAATFWFWVVLIGLVIPGLVELITVLPRLVYDVPFRAHRSLEFAVSAAVLIGGFMLRYVIVVAGQITAPAGI